MKFNNVEKILKLKFAPSFEFRFTLLEKSWQTFLISCEEKEQKVLIIKFYNSVEDRAKTN